MPRCSQAACCCPPARCSGQPTPPARERRPPPPFWPAPTSPRARPPAASSNTQNYVASNVTDGNQGTYWESANNAFPQWVQVDLGSSVSTNQVVLKLPDRAGVRAARPSRSRAAPTARTSTICPPPRPGRSTRSGNTVTIDYGASTVRYLRIRITANTGWPAGQLSELEVYGPATGDTQAPTAPGSLAFTEPGRRPDPAHLERLHRQRRRHRVRRLRERRAANQRRRQRLDVHGQPAGQRLGQLLRPREGCRRQPIAEQQHRHSRRQQRPGQQPGARQADHRVRVRAHLRRDQRERRQRDDLLGGQRQPGHADHPARLERGPQLDRDPAQPGLRLGQPHPDVLDPRAASRARPASPRSSPRPRTTSARPAATP